MIYATLYITQKDGRVVRPLCSDSVFTLDGRNSFDTWVNDAKAQAKRFKNIKNYTHIKLFKGVSFTSSCAISELIKVYPDSSFDNP